MGSLARKHSAKIAESGGDDDLSPFEKVQHWVGDRRGYLAVTPRLTRSISSTQSAPATTMQVIFQTR